jgi:hypothetical protein
MGDIPAALADEVRLRAHGLCEYCGLSQLGQEAVFHIDHIVPRAAAGPTVSDNLALACVSCSLRKGARRTAVDPETGSEEPLFHPRQKRWVDHFRWVGERVVPLTPTGRATVAALAMNRPIILAIRQEEMIRGRHPPPDRFSTG